MNTDAKVNRQVIPVTRLEMLYPQAYILDVDQVAIEEMNILIREFWSPKFRSVDVFRDDLIRRINARIEGGDQWFSFDRLIKAFENGGWNVIVFPERVLFC